MHKGRNYALWPQYRPFSAGSNYPDWAPASIDVTDVTWQGSAATSAPDAPFTLFPSGVTPAIRARYECTLFDHGAGEYAVLFLDFYIVLKRFLKMRVGGDWGVNGELPDVAGYNFNGQWTSFSSFFNGTSTPPEDYLMPLHLVWEATPYPP